MKRRIKGTLKKLGWFALAYFGVGYLIAFFDGNCVPLHKQGDRHCDYYFRAVKSIPWGWTTRCLVQPPIMIAGNSRNSNWTPGGQAGPKPIPKRGEWELTAVQVKPGWPIYLVYFAITFGDGMHYRIGTRWDDVDDYYVVFSIARRNLNPKPAADKSLASNTTCK